MYAYRPSVATNNLIVIFLSWYADEAPSTTPSGFTYQGVLYDGGGIGTFVYTAVYGVDTSSSFWTFTASANKSYTASTVSLNGDWSNETPLITMLANYQSDANDATFTTPSPGFVTAGDYTQFAVFNQYVSSASTWSGITSLYTSRADVFSPDPGLNHSHLLCTYDSTAYQTLRKSCTAEASQNARGTESIVMIGLPQPPGPSFTRDGVAGTGAAEYDGVATSSVADIDGVDA
jgi:hypothetical protein